MLFTIFFDMARYALYHQKTIEAFGEMMKIHGDTIYVLYIYIHILLYTIHVLDIVHILVYI